MNIVIQAYGREDIIRQAQYSVLSCLRLLDKNSPARLILYTDKVSQLERFFVGQSRVEFVPLTLDIIKRFRGAIDFVHRVKVEVLIDAAKRYPGPLFYVDGDTIFQSDPTKLFARVNDQTSLMHISENPIDRGTDPLSKKLFRFFRKNTFTVNGQQISIPTHTIMYNAGALGISEKNLQLLPEVLALTDITYAAYPKHIMEQLAFSFILQTRTQIITAEREILHYWAEKDRYQVAIDDFLRRFQSAAEALANWNQFVLPESKKAPPKSRWSIRSLFMRSH